MKKWREHQKGDPLTEEIIQAIDLYMESMGKRGFDVEDPYLGLPEEDILEVSSDGGARVVTPTGDTYTVQTMGGKYG